MDAPVPEDPPATAARSADWTIEQGWDAYTRAEHGVWKTLFERQTRLLPGRACDAFLAGMHALPIGAEAIPDFRRLSEVLMRRTDRKSTRLNSSHLRLSRMPSSA